MFKAKYVAVSHTIRDAIQIRLFLNGLLPEQVVKTMKMLGNNKINYTLTKDHKSQNCTKHINLIYYYVKRLIESRESKI